MRLTEKIENNEYCSSMLKNMPPDPLVDRLAFLDKVWQKERNKLGQLEDIEDELGIDLVTFFKFLDSKVCYEKDLDDNEITKCLITGITKTGVLNVQEAFPYGECEREAKFKDYGRTWALTKEELE